MTKAIIAVWREPLMMYSFLTGKFEAVSLRKPQRPRRRRAAPVKPTVAAELTEPMLKAAMATYSLTVANRDSPIWAVILIFRSLRRAALLAEGGHHHSVIHTHTSKPVHIRTAQGPPNVRHHKAAVELALPVSLTNSMQSDAANVYQRCIQKYCSPEVAIKAIYKELHQAALEEEENE
jgi:hypothetical protein